MPNGAGREPVTLPATPTDREVVVVPAGAAATAGVSGVAIAGDRGRAGAGHGGAAIAGTCGTAECGPSDVALAGYCGRATSGEGGVARAGREGLARGDVTARGCIAYADREGRAEVAGNAIAFACGGAAVSGEHGISACWNPRDAAGLRAISSAGRCGIAIALDEGALVRAGSGGVLIGCWTDARNRPRLAVRKIGRRLQPDRLGREAVVSAIAEQVRGVTATNFKNSVAERWRHDGYLDVWNVLYRAQKARAAK